MKIGIPKESRAGENRLASTPDTAKKLIKKGIEVLVETGAGERAGFSDKDFETAGVKIVSRADAFGQKVVLKVHAPNNEETHLLQAGSLLVSFLEPYKAENAIALLAQKKIDAMSMELIPRTSRAQSMDALSSQAGIAGYRAVLEAATHYRRFFPMMMTSAGMSKPAKCIILGAGVAGLQAIATARKLGAQVEAFDVRAEVKEQILSLGAKFIDLDLGEEGSGAGGYAKQLSEDAQRKQQDALAERLKKADIVISTANIPGKKSPVLITENAVQGMRTGSVIIDMAAANGGNCPLSKPDQVIHASGVTIVGHTNYPSMVPADASQFYSNNLISLLQLVLDEKGELKMNLEDDIVAASLVSYQGQVRK